MFAAKRTGTVVAVMLIATVFVAITADARADGYSVSYEARSSYGTYVPANYYQPSATLRYASPPAYGRHDYRPAPAYASREYYPAPTYISYEYRPSSAYLSNEYRPVPLRVSYEATYPQPVYSVARVVSEAPMVEYVPSVRYRRVARHRCCAPSPRLYVSFQRDRPHRHHRALHRSWPHHRRHHHYGYGIGFDLGWPVHHRHHRHGGGFSIRLGR